MKPLNIVILTEACGFPHGMAGTQRIRLLARSLVENGCIVTVLCMRVTENPSFIENKDVRGSYQNIKFEYTPGTTIRATSFIRRRRIELVGIANTLLHLIIFKSHGELDCIYSYMDNYRFNFLSLFIRYFAKLINVPVVGDFRERPWTLESNTYEFPFFISPLAGLRGVVTISNYLSDWVNQEAKKKNFKIKLLEVPILVDLDEQFVTSKIDSEPIVLFAGSPSYDQTIQFIIEAMKVVWADFSSCKLVITGAKTGDRSTIELEKIINESNLGNKIFMPGYLSREELLYLYTTASALLIPLFNDVRSLARFPTKIGEYLSSGNPVVTTSVGEINRYFRYDVDAFICAPNDPILYGKKILEVLQNPEKANRVGISGREVAVNTFNYSNYGGKLLSFLRQFVN